MFAEIPDWAKDTAAWIGVATAVIVFTGLVFRRPARYAWRKLVSEPISAWISAQMREQLEPLSAEIVGVRADLVNHMGEEVAQSVKDASAQVEFRDRLRAEFREDLDKVRDDVHQTVGTLHRRLDEILDKKHPTDPERLQSRRLPGATR